jgi:hypothetical protein
LGLFFVLSAPSEKPDLTARQLGTAILLSLLVSYAPGELIWTNQLTTKFSTLQTEKMKLEELQDFYKKYAPAEVGLGDGDHYMIHSRQRASIIRTFLWFLINFAKAFWQTTRSLNKANSTGFGAVGAPGELPALLALAC